MRANGNAQCAAPHTVIPADAGPRRLEQPVNKLKPVRIPAFAGMTVFGLMWCATRRHHGLPQGFEGRKANFTKAATVFMLRAVPSFAAGTDSLERPMPLGYLM